MAWTNDLILCRAGLGMRLHRGRRLHWLRVQGDYSCRLAGYPVVAHRVVTGGNRHTAGRSLTQEEITKRIRLTPIGGHRTASFSILNVFNREPVCTGRG